MPALPHQTKLFSVKDAMFYPLLTDPAAGVATYSAGVLVPGCKGGIVTGTVLTVDLRGGNTFIDTDSVLQSVMIELDYAKLQLDFLTTLLGGAVVDAGSTPAQTTTWTLPNPATFGYFKIAMRPYAVDSSIATPGGVAGDVHIVASKVKLADFPSLGLTEEAYTTQKLKCKVVPPTGTSAWFQIVENETAIVLS